MILMRPHNTGFHWIAGLVRNFKVAYFFGDQTPT